MSSKTLKIALVTGASAGIGEEFARQIDSQREVDEIWLIARRRDRLETLGAKFSHAKARVITADLSKRDGLAEVASQLETAKPEVVWLVNNAGFGKISRFDREPLATNLEMVDLNVRALTELTQRCLPYCRPGSRIVQVASNAAFQPVPVFSLYAATKAFVLSFSEALHAELRPRGIHVTAVCPGPVATEFFEVATGSRRATLGMDTPAKVVAAALRDASRGRLHSFPSFRIRVLSWLGRHSARPLVLWLFTRRSVLRAFGSSAAQGM